MGKIYTQLSIADRTMIQAQLNLGSKPATISLVLNRSASTISRKLSRNSWARPKVHTGPGRPLLSGGYRSELAQKLAGTCTVKPRVLSVDWDPQPHCGAYTLIDSKADRIITQTTTTES